MADFTWGNSSLNVNKLPYAIIDGKQRLEAIFDFFDGKIILNDDFVYLKNPTFKIGGLGYKDLQQNYVDIAEEFDTYNLSVMSVLSDSEELINNLFVRLNRNKPLTGAEIRNAMTRPVPKVIRSIAKHEIFATNVKFAVKRGADLNVAGKILMFEYYEKLLETKKRNLDNFVQSSTDQKEGRFELAGRRAVEVLNVMATIFLPKDRLLSQAGVFPVYYWLIRSLEEKDYPKLREFLVHIEAERKTTLMLVAKDSQSKNIDQELVQFNSYYRSPNDKSILEGRYRILQNRFLKRISSKSV